MNEISSWHVWYAMYVLVKQQLVCSQFCIFSYTILSSKIFQDVFFMSNPRLQNVRQWVSEHNGFKKVKPPYFGGG
jgi:hypothetical protein